MALILDLPTPGGDLDAWGGKLNTAISAVAAAVDALTAATAGTMLTVTYNGSWPARPTASTNVTVMWIGPSVPSSGMLTGDWFFLT